MLKADNTDYLPEIEQMLAELGNESGGLPFYAVFPARGGPPITFGGGYITQAQVLENLQKATAEDSAPTISNAEIGKPILDSPM